jgi:hypothetical protein
MTGEVRFCFTPGETGGRTTLFTGARMFRV